MNNLEKNFDEIEFDNNIISAVRSMVERVIRCIKVWKIMYDPFRGKIWQTHGIYSYAVVRLVQWLFEEHAHCTFDESLTDCVFGDASDVCECGHQK